MKPYVFTALSLLCVVAVPAFAQTAPAAGPMTSSQPIEINADSLEVRQQENIAVFTGNVIAVQGTTKLKSDVMTVHYRKKEEAPGAPKEQAGSLAPGQNAVEKIEVNGHVLMTTPEETANGDRGIYEVDNHQVRLMDHVVLTRGRNILKGDTLVHDLNSGKSVVNSPFHQNEATPGVVNGRVRALFVPEKSGDKASEKSKP